MLEIFGHFCFTYNHKMSYLRISYRIIVFNVLFCFACNSGNADKEKIKEAYDSLKENEASVLFKIDNKEFYSPQSIFRGEIQISDNLFSMTLVDQSEARTIVNFGGDKWYSQSPIKKEVFVDDQGGASIKIGKIIDQEKMIGEGYQMIEGTITAKEFSKEKMVFKITGKAGKYSDFQQPDKYVPVDGLIVYKMPKINYRNITEKEVFHSSDNK